MQNVKNTNQHFKKNLETKNLSPHLTLNKLTISNGFQIGYFFAIYMKSLHMERTLELVIRQNS